MSKRFGRFWPTWALVAAVSGVALEMLTNSPDTVVGFGVLFWVIVQAVSIRLSLSVAELTEISPILMAAIGTIASPVVIIGIPLLMLSFGV